MKEQTEIASRLKRVRLLVGLSKDDFSTKLGWPVSRVRNLESGNLNRLDPLQVEQLESVVLSLAGKRINKGWLLSGEGEMFLSGPVGPKQESFIQATFYEDVRASAGPGRYGLDHPETQELGFAPSLLNLAGITAPKNGLMLIRVEGHSMEPTLASGDLALVEKFNGRVDEGATYVLRYGDDILVKQLQPLKSEGALRLISINPAYETQKITGLDLEQIEIIGKVTGKIGRV